MVIEDLVSLYRGRILSIASYFHMKTGIPAEDYISKLYEELWMCSKDFDEGKGASLDTWVNHRFKKAIVNVIRSREGTYRRRFKSCIDAGNDDDSDDGAATPFTIRDASITDDHFIKKRKRLDQKILIESLLQPAKTDPVTTAIVTIFESHGGNLRSIGKSLGLHPEKVKRKLRALARRYDGNRFGDIRDYLAV